MLVTDRFGEQALLRVARAFGQDQTTSIKMG